MVKDKRVSLWLGFFESREVLNEYNSVVLLYRYEYSGLNNPKNRQIKHMGNADLTG